MAYAFVKDNTAVEVVAADPFMLFVPGYASQFIEIPDGVQSGWKFSNGEWHAPVVVFDRLRLINDIDRRADSLRLAIVGDPVRVEEYRLARDEAAAYIAAGYAGAVPPTVQDWATAKTWTAQQAADDIAATAQAWESALYAIRSIRLIGKESVRSAATDSAAQTAYDAVLAQLSSIGGA